MGERTDLFTTSDLPDFHDDLLLVKFQPDGRHYEPFMAAVRGDWESHSEAAPAVAAVVALERAGAITRVIPLSSDTPRARSAPDGALNPLDALADAAEAPRDDPNAGVSALELAPGTDPESVANELRADPSAEFVSRVPVRYLMAQAAAPASAPQGYSMWNLLQIRWLLARTRPGYAEPEGITVAVLDTGIDSGHPSLIPALTNYRHMWSDLPASESDVVGHGTHVAGTIAASTNSGGGIFGICHPRLLAWKIFNDVPEYVGPQHGFMYVVHPIMYRRALSEALAQNVDVINLSIGGQQVPEPAELNLFQALIARGTVVVAAMGNERTPTGSPICYPANIPGVIAVGASNDHDGYADFSNGGPHISLVAPGVGIWSTLPTYPGQLQFRAVIGPDGKPTLGQPFPRDVNYAAWPGTSMASPHVAAAVAMLLGNKGKASPADVRRRLMDTAVKVPGMRGTFDEDFGAGRLDLWNLLA